MGSRKYPPLRDRIDEKIDRSAGPNGCHPWTGGFSQLGVPNISVGKSGGSARRRLWQIVNGELPRTRLVIMSCGNRACMNIEHMALQPVKDPVTRFWSYVNRTAGCWEWTGSCSREGRNGSRRGAGYGNFMVTWKSIVSAHRYSWELANGPVPPGMFVCHRCDNPACVRPEHLFLGTAKDNTQDMLTKGRGAAQQPGFGDKIRAAHERRRAVSGQRQGKGEEG